eukprot:scaffold384497_cov41-Prasinocladus_malaysianus.AAC.1
MCDRSGSGLPATDMGMLRGAVKIPPMPDRKEVVKDTSVCGATATGPVSLQRTIIPKKQLQIYDASLCLQFQRSNMRRANSYGRNRKQAYKIPTMLITPTSNTNFAKSQTIES